MIVPVLLLVGLYAARAGGQDFVCGYAPGEGSFASASEKAFYRSGTITPLVLFGKLKGSSDPINIKDRNKLKDRNDEKTQRAGDLFKRGHKGSLAHYFLEMSYGALKLEGEVDTAWYESDEESVSGYKKYGKPRSQLYTFAREVIKTADASVDFSKSVYDRNDDGTVDLLILYYPVVFKSIVKFSGTVTPLNYETADTTSNGSNVIVNRILLVETLESFPHLVGIAAHEYGHVMGLGELFDRTHFDEPTSEHKDHSAGVGRYGMMGTGAHGWVKVKNVVDGPTPMTAWSRTEVGWITSANGRLVTVSADTSDVQIHDINSDAGKVYKIPLPGSAHEYFLLANRQNTYGESGSNTVGSYYDDFAPSSGLAVWHVDERAGPVGRVNEYEDHKRVDLECADGLFADKGYPDGKDPDTVTGGDNLDYWSKNSTYTADYNGNFADGTDLWDGVSDTTFTPYTNPSTAGYKQPFSEYEKGQQSVFTGISVAVKAKTGGVMKAAIGFLPLQPTDLTAGGGSSPGQAELRWKAPANSTFDKWQYRQETDTQGFGQGQKTGTRVWGPWTDVAGDGTKRSHTVTGLTKNETYRFLVRARNKAGYGPPSDTLTVLPLRTQAGAGAATLTWTSPSGYGALAQWRYRQKKDDEKKKWEVWRLIDNSTASTTSHTVLDLIPGLQYHFQVEGRASGGLKIGVSTFTDSVTPTWPPVTGLLATAGDRQAALSWNDPDVPSITQWKRNSGTLSGSDTTWAGWQVMDHSGASTTSDTVTGLTNGTSYTFQVQAVNATGDGPPSAPSAAVRPAGPPLAPTLTAAAGDRRVALRWTAADSNGAWVTGYSLRDSSAGGSWSSWTAVPGGGTARDSTRTGLTNGTRYWFAVRATNRVGTGRADTLSATPQARTLAGADSISYAENGTDTVAVYRVTPAGGSWTWSRAGADSSAFTGGDTLRFAQVPNYEKPVDADSNNVYTLQVQATPAAPGLSSLSKAVVVTVTNVNEPGAISFSPSRPKVNQPITATLSDADTVASVRHWRWLPYIEGGVGIGGEEEASVEAASSGLSSTYTPNLFFRNLPLEVTVFYADRLASGQQQVRVVTAPVGGPNRGPTLSGVSDTTFVENDTSAVALYTGADADGDALRWSLTGADSSAFRWQGSGLTRALRFAAAPDYEAKSTYRVTAGVSDGAVSATQAVTVRVTNVDEAPVLSGPADTTVVEHGSGTVALYRAVDPEGEAVTWSLSGADRDTLALSGGGQLSFKRAPDYERPVDADSDNVYAVRVRAFDGPLGDSLAVTVRVSNVEEAGTVRLSPTAPQAGTALSATLSDPDSVWASTVGWQWQRLSSRSAAGTPIGSATSASYTPQGADVGRWLVAKASYRDGHGAGKSATDTTATAVAGRPGAPKSLAASAGDKQVALRWTAADSNGAWVTGYSLRDSLAGGSWSAWTAVPGGGAARKDTVTGLTNDTLYTFEVRAKNRVGTGDSSRVSARPQAVPPAPDTLIASAGNRRVALSWTYTSSVPVIRWQERHKAGSRAWGSWTDVAHSTGSTRKDTVTGLTNDTLYTFEVRGVNGKGAGTASNPATATPWEDIPPILSGSAGNRQVALSWVYTGKAPVSSWQYRRESALGDFSGQGQQTSTRIWGPWTNIPGSNGSTRKDTVTGLTNGSKYGFEVRGLHGSIKRTASNKVIVTPQAAPPPPAGPPAATLSASAGNAQVALSWIYSSTSNVTGWQQRHKAGSKTWGPWTGVAGSTGSTRKDTVTGLTNDTLYTFEVRGLNGQIKGTASNQVTATPKAPPPTGPPAATLSASAGNAQVALSWIYSSTSNVTGWQQRHKAGSKTWGPWTGVAGSTGSTRKDTVTGLTNDTLYTFEVRGLNGQIKGTASNQVTATPKAPPPSPPDRPDKLTASAGNRQVTLNWTYTSTVTVTGWQYRRESALGDFSAGQKTSTRIWGPWTPISGAATRSHTVTGLTNGSEYGFEVRGVNGKVKGTASNKVTATPKAPPPPAPPAPTLSASAGNGRVTLSWAYTSTVTVTGWQYRRESNFEDLSGGQKTTTRVWGPWKSISGADTRSHTVTGLTNGSEYGFEVRGVNGKTEGTASNKVTVTPKAPATVPGSPGSLSAAAGNKQVALSWSAAASNGSAIQRYEYRRGSGSWTTVSGGGSARSQTVTGLTNGTSYTFSVRAVNGKGAGTAASASATPAGRPGSPGGLSASAGNRQVTLSWSAAAPNGSAIQRYEYRRGAGSWTTVSGGGSARSQTVTGLTNGTSYTFSVRAVNGKGAGTAASASGHPGGASGISGGSVGVGRQPAGDAELECGRVQRLGHSALRIPPRPPRQLDHGVGRRFGAQPDGHRPDQRHDVYLLRARGQRERRRLGRLRLGQAGGGAGVSGESVGGGGLWPGDAELECGRAQRLGHPAL